MAAVKRAPSFREAGVAMLPGKHAIGISFDNGGYRSTTVPVFVLDAGAGHVYEVGGELVAEGLMGELARPITGGHWRYWVVEPESGATVTPGPQGAQSATPSAPIVVPTVLP